MNEKKQLAQHLYMTQGKTQKEIAQAVGVSERTIYTWIHQYAWDKMKQAAYQAPAVIAENLCNQLVELQNAIAKREPGNRYPTPQEAEVTRKLITCIEKMKKYPSLSQNMQMMETFKAYVRPQDKEFTKKLANYSEQFLSGKSVNGFAPYEMEYGVEQVAPVMSFDDESYVEDPGTCPDPQACHQAQACACPGQCKEPCSDIEVCLHPGACTFPKCTKVCKTSGSLISETRKTIPLISDETRQAQYHNYMTSNGFTILPVRTIELPASPAKPEQTGSDPALE